MAGVEAKLDTRALSKALGRIDKRTAFQALKRSLNRAGTTMRKEASQHARKTYTAKARDVKKSMRFRRARSGTLGTSVEVGISLRPLPLSTYSARQLKRKGVSIKVKRSEPRKRLPKSFVATMKSGHTGVFRRRVVGGKPVKRLPIDEVYGPGIGHTLRAREIRRIMLRKGREQFERDLAHEIRRATRS